MPGLYAANGQPGPNSCGFHAIHMDAIVAVLQSLWKPVGDEWMANKSTDFIVTAGGNALWHEGALSLLFHCLWGCMSEEPLGSNQCKDSSPAED